MFGRDQVDGVGEDSSSEGEPLLNETWLSAAEERFSSTETMAPQTASKQSTETLTVPLHVERVDHPLESLTPGRDLDSANLRAQGHEAVLQRSFSPLAALGLGFRHVSFLFFLFQSIVFP